MTGKATFLDPLRRADAPRYRLVNRRHGAVLATDIVTAFDSASRRTGLLKHDSMPQGFAMVIAPTNAIHTFFMRFPIDVAFVNREGRTVSARRHMVPWRLAAAWGGFAVIELPSGTLERSDTVQGDMLVLAEP